MAASETNHLAQLPLEVISTILSKLRPLDLHNCRLVSTKFNELCLSILRRPSNSVSGHIYHLPYSKIKDYIRFVRKTNAEIFTPFRISFTSCLASAEDVFPVLRALKSLAGPECISEVSGMNDLNEEVILKILGCAALGLTSLKLPCDFTSSPEINAVGTLCQYPALTFPRLEKLTCFNLGKEYRVFYSILGSRCPVLKEFNSHYKFTADGIIIPFQELKSLALKEFTGWEFLLDQIKSTMPQPKVENLTMDVLITDQSTYEAFTGVMEALAPTLKTLSYSLASFHPFLFPKCPRLDNLSILDECQFGFTPHLLPALKSIQFPVDMCLLGCGLGQNFVFPTVTAVTWHISRLRDRRLNFDKVIENVFTAFPNVTRIGVDTFDAEEEDFACVIQVILHLMKSPLATTILEFEMKDFGSDYLGEALLQIEEGENRPEGVLKWMGANFTPTVSPEVAKAATLNYFKELGLDPSLYSAMQIAITEPSNSDNDSYILKVAHENQGHYFKNVQKITVKQKTSSSSGFNTKNLDLVRFENHFPKLRVLEFSSNMVRSKNGCLRKIQERFTSWSIHLVDVKADDWNPSFEVLGRRFPS